MKLVVRCRASLEEPALGRIETRTACFTAVPSRPGQEVTMRVRKPRKRLLVLPVLLVLTLVLTACPAPAHVVVGEVVERETGKVVENATITMTLVDEEGEELDTTSCQDCQALSGKVNWPDRGDKMIVRVEAPGYVPWQAESPSSEVPAAPSGSEAGYRVELTPLTGLEAYRAELAAAVEKVENLLSEAQRRHFPPEAFEQSLGEALTGLHRADENLAGLATPSPTPETGD